MVCAEAVSKVFAVRDYNLETTLTSGQAFRWRRQDQSWEGVIGDRWVRMRASRRSIMVQTAEPVQDWTWLTEYLQLECDLSAVLASFPADSPMQAAVDACRGLRLLRQDPWECLASFILSSTKRIVQIQHVISILCERYGRQITAEGPIPTYSFPRPEGLARLAEAELRECKMGFRAPFLLGAARKVAEGKIDLAALHQLPLEEAREELLKLEGVGRKISDCVLLFAFGRQTAFPIDVWVMKTLRQLYFAQRHVKLPELQAFAATHFGPNAGYAQQYLFHYARSQLRPGREATV